MSKQTAVEWLTPKILGLTIELSKRKISQRTCELEIMKLIEQAKAMEREQTCTSNQVPFYETCYCNPKNGGSGICGCTISNKIVYGK